MKDIDPIMKQTFLKDYTDYLTIIKALEMEQLDTDTGIEQLQTLIDDIIDDMFIMDQDTHDLFITQRNKISLENKERKEQRLLRMKDPNDQLDDRNIKRLLNKQYDLPKHRQFLKIIKEIAYRNGWFR